MRASGLTYDSIARDLGVSKGTLSLWLSGAAGSTSVPTGEAIPQGAVPSTVPDTVGLRGQARTMREHGLLLKEIAGQLDISIRTAGRCTSDLPLPQRARHGGDEAHVRAMSEARWGPHRRRRDAAAQQRKLEAANAVGAVDDRTLLLLGAVVYWREGAKSKPWRPQGKFSFINSDPLLMRLVVRWL